MPASSFRSGHEANFYYAPESAAYPSGNAVPAPAMPGAVVWGGWATIPDVDTDDGTKEVFGLGSPQAQTIIPGGRAHAMSVTTRVGNKALLQKCLRGSGGFRDLADLCLVTGYSDIHGDGVSLALRYAKCASLVLAMQEGSAQEITAQMQFQGLAEEIGSVLSPTNADLLAQGVPLTWHNITQINIGGVNVRDVCAGVTLSVTHTLERKNFRPDYGPSPWSRTSYALLPHRTTYSAELNFHTPDVAREVLGLVGSDTYTDGFGIVATTAGSTTEGTGAVTLNVAASAGRVKTRKRRGGDDSQELMGTVSLALIGLAIS